MSRGQLRVYLGAAPGVGKTVAMLAEGARSAARGKDVVIAVVEDHGRAYTATMTGHLPVVPRRMIRYRGIELSDMDTAAVLAKAQAVADGGADFQRDFDTARALLGFAWPLGAGAAEALAVAADASGASS